MCVCVCVCMCVCVCVCDELLADAPTTSGPGSGSSGDEGCGDAWLGALAGVQGGRRRRRLRAAPAAAVAAALQVGRFADTVGPCGACATSSPPLPSCPVPRPPIPSPKIGPKPPLPSPESPPPSVTVGGCGCDCFYKAAEAVAGLGRTCQTCCPCRVNVIRGGGGGEGGAIRP